MGIPESQLESWSHQGAEQLSARTYASIQAALASVTSQVDVQWEIYLQGSYRNSTNIRGDSDVDVVTQLLSTFEPDTTHLTDYERRSLSSAYPIATYDLVQFKADVVRALRATYGSDKISEGRKAIRVTTPYLPADVVVARTYRQYMSFSNINNQTFNEGMAFYVSQENRWIVNYPKQHYSNGVKKHDRTQSRYKSTVRMFKNARSYCDDIPALAPHLPPSYFLECLLYNVPDSKFSGSFQNIYQSVVAWLKIADLQGFTCQNEIVPLFGSNQEQWTTTEADTAIAIFSALWETWKN